MSELTLLPPISDMLVIWGMFSENSCNTSKICEASSRIGLMMTAPMSWVPKGVERAFSFSRMGMMKARVLPLPVTASTATSLQPKNKGIVDS